MLSCWSCGHAFRDKLVVRDGLLRGRQVEKGGPYRLYQCPACRKESRVESTPAGRLFASPDKNISPVDYLFGWIPSLSPFDFLKILHWDHCHAEERRFFFERDGDDRYSRRSLGRFLRRLFLGRSVEEAPPPGEKRSSRPREKPPVPVPHPFQILGLRPGASEADIRQAFRKLARRWHPDKQASRDPRTLEEANRRLRELMEAYEKLLRETDTS